MRSHRVAVWSLAAALFLVVVSAAALVAQTKREFSVTGRRYTYVVSDASKPEIRVRLNDMVVITFTAEDIPHSFTISDDHYRVDKRAKPGSPTVIQFRAVKDGSFDIRCTLTDDPRCVKEMRGKLIVAGPESGR
jgi:heme/copper-type cytochrome/quinol oxidase subunit 2